MQEHSLESLLTTLMVCLLKWSRDPDGFIGGCFSFGWYAATEIICLQVRVVGSQGIWEHYYVNEGIGEVLEQQ